MDDKSALLDQLRIDRGAAAPPSRRLRVWVTAIAIALLVAAAAVWNWTRPTAIAVHAAVAQTVAGNTPTIAGSILDASGYVVARRQATVSSKITDKMVELDIEEGDHVKAGQIIAKLDDTNIRAALNQASAQLNYAKAGLAETEVNLGNAQREFERQSSLVEQHFVSQSALDTARTARDALRAQLETQKSNIQVSERNLNYAERNLDDTIVRAPFSGIVTVKAAQPGEIVSPISAGGGFTRTGIGTIVDMDSLEIQVDVNENFINRVTPAQRVNAKLNAYPDWQIPAHVIAVIPTADRAKGTVTVRIALDNSDPRILPEMGVRVSFLEEAAGSPAPQGAAGVSVPNDAVQASGATGVVYVVHDDRLERRAVRLGASTGAGATIISGLAAGERVAVGDLKTFSDGARVRLVQGGS
jgi:RND family efflux transporter MFP subunit